MKPIIVLLFLLTKTSMFAQSEKNGITQGLLFKNLDNFQSPILPINCNPIGEVKHGKPVILANDIVVRIEELSSNNSIASVMQIAGKERKLFYTLQ